MVDIYIDKLYRYPRIQECVHIAVPFKKGELNTVEDIAIIQNGKECLIQPRVTSRYDDGSVRFLFVSFMADLPANKRAKVLLVTDKKEYDKAISETAANAALNIAGNVTEAVPEAAVVKETANGFMVDCGAISYEVSNASESIFASLNDGRKQYTSDNFVGPILRDKAGNDYKMHINKWRVVQSGPVEVVLAADIHNSSQPQPEAVKNADEAKNIEAQLRLTAYAGKP